eukprot:1147995-Pelagomonas_calceolata.AAC.17
MACSSAVTKAMCLLQLDGVMTETICQLRAGFAKLPASLATLSSLVLPAGMGRIKGARDKLHIQTCAKSHFLKGCLEEFCYLLRTLALGLFDHYKQIKGILDMPQDVALTK